MLKFWNNGNPILAVISGSGMRQTLKVDDKVIRTGNVAADPTIDLYDAEEVGPFPGPLEVESVPVHTKVGNLITTTRTVSWKPSAEIRSERIEEVKAAASGIIYAFASSTKQANLMARKQELSDIISGQLINTDGTFEAARALATAEVAEAIAMRAAWNYIKAVRTASNQFEANLALIADTDPAALVALQPTWPVMPVCA